MPAMTATVEDTTVDETQTHTDENIEGAKQAKKLNTPAKGTNSQPERKIDRPRRASAAKSQPLFAENTDTETEEEQEKSTGDEEIQRVPSVVEKRQTVSNIHVKF